MGERLAVTCDSCREPMVPNVSTLDDDGCGWICLSPGCPELAAGELEAEDLVEAGVPEALAGRLARLIDHYEDAPEARAVRRTRSRGNASGRRPSCASPRARAELRRLAEGALAAHLGDSLVVAPTATTGQVQDARQAFAAAGALCAVLRRTAADAQHHPAGVDLDLSGLLATASSEESKLSNVHWPSRSSLWCHCSRSRTRYA